MKRIVIITVFIGLATGLFATDIAPEEILRVLDSRANFGSDYLATITMIVEEKGQQFLSEVRFFRRDSEDKMLLLFLRPEYQKGTGYLRAGENWWMYDPESRRFSHSSPHESIGDSDYENDDFTAFSYLRDYDVTGFDKGTLSGNNVYVLTLKARNNEVTIPAQKIWVTIDEYLLLKQEDYAVSGRHTRTILRADWVRVGDNMVPQKTLSINELHKGSKTLLLTKDISTMQIDDHVFTKPYLERVNK